MQMKFLFWLLVKNAYPSSSDKAIKVSLPSVITCLCETRFSTVAVNEKKTSTAVDNGKDTTRYRSVNGTSGNENGKLCAEK
jgi:hypothetical protein